MHGRHERMHPPRLVQQSKQQNGAAPRARQWPVRPVSRAQYEGPVGGALRRGLSALLLVCLRGMLHELGCGDPRVARRPRQYTVIDEASAIAKVLESIAAARARVAGGGAEDNASSDEQQAEPR